MNHHHDHDEHELEMKKATRPQIERDNKYWLSLEQYNQDAEFIKKAEAEFQSSPLREEEKENPWARRDFLKLMSASIAMTTAGCIRRPVQKIVPYNKQPEEVTLGVANLYTSVYSDSGDMMGVLVKTREGRPIKIESNPKHGFNMGGTSARAQASLLSLYDPERLQNPKRNLFNEKKSNFQTVNVKWEDLDAKVVEQLKKGGVAVLTGSLHSPSTRAVVGDFVQAFGARHYQWESITHEDVREGQKLAYGDDSVPLYRLDKARVIVSVDADFLGTWLTPTTFTGQFSRGRKDPKDMNRLIAFDSQYSLTGANADIRFRIKPSQQVAVVMGLLHELIVKKGVSSYSGNSAVKSLLSSYADVPSQVGIEAEAFAKVASDLWANKGKSLVLAGGLEAMTDWAKDLQVAVNFLNSILENEGQTVLGRQGNESLKTSYTDALSLIEDLKNGKIQTLIIHRVNPAYTLPEDMGFKEAVKKAKMVVYTGDRIDETGIFADYLAPDNHPLETWSDAEFAKGVYSIAQPTIRPLYDTRSFQLSLMTWAYLAEKGSKRLTTYESFYDFLRSVWKEEIYPATGRGQKFEDFWLSLLQEGFVGALASSASVRSFRLDALLNIRPVTAKSDFELVLYSKVGLGDGTFANISWLQELPDPITKIVWDNYAMVSLATSEKLKLKEGTLVQLKVGEKTLDLPVHIQPGLHDGVVAVAVGYGRTRAGKVGNSIGQNAFSFLQKSGSSVVGSGAPVSLMSLNKKYELACTQGHHSMEGRQIVVVATNKDYEKKPDANIHRHATWSLWSGHKYNGHKWGMAIDLNSCTGCSACVVACQSENNIPVVGKKYILDGREMHWLRIDRYYTGTPENAETVFQPVMCQHCDNAPCETVCPVVATVHSSEGLNDMVYNRCVGTRYCSNNCPYKVRRFNWFNYTKNIEKPLHMALNPSVGVRSRGVMEKCTFCVQRIQEGKQKAKLENRPLKDGDIKTACQTACPTEGIIFGDMNDSNSQVAQIFKNEPRAYTLLEEWHAAPAVRYMSKIRNNDKETAQDHGHGGHSKQGEHS